MLDRLTFKRIQYVKNIDVNKKVIKVYSLSECIIAISIRKPNNRIDMYFEIGFKGFFFIRYVIEKNKNVHEYGIHIKNKISSIGISNTLIPIR